MPENGRIWARQADCQDETGWVLHEEPGLLITSSENEAIRSNITYKIYSPHVFF
jgi:hypothetical protein